MKNLISIVFLLLITGCCTERSPEIPAVTGFEVGRYLGKWYEIARLPNVFEKGLEEVTAEYTLRPDGRLQVINRGMKDGKIKQITGIARFAGPAHTGELEVSFFRPFYGSYRIIRLAPDYSTACVMGGSRDLAWILARTPELPEGERQKLLAFFRAKGFAVEKFLFPRQKTAGQ